MKYIQAEAMGKYIKEKTLKSGALGWDEPMEIIAVVEIDKPYLVNP